MKRLLYLLAPLALLLLLAACDSASVATPTPVPTIPLADVPTTAPTPCGSCNITFTEVISDAATINSNNTPLKVGTDAPNFSLHDTEGNTYTLSDYKGKVVLLEFMATWCPHCQDFAPMFDTLWTQYQGKDVQFFDINATPWNHEYESGSTGLASTDDLRWFKTNYNVQYPLLFDPLLKSTNDYGVQGYPTVYIIGKDGKIADFPDYPYSQDQLSKSLDAALSK